MGWATNSNLVQAKCVRPLEQLRKATIGDSADTCAVKFPLMSMRADWKVSRAQTRKPGPPSARAEIWGIFFLLLLIPLFKSPEGGLVGFQNFARASNSQKYQDSNQNYLETPSTMLNLGTQRG